jgi:hypothetical protein
MYVDSEGLSQQVLPQIQNHGLQVSLLNEDLFDPSSNNYLPKLVNEECAILIYGYEGYNNVRNLHKSGEIHIGLRKFTYTDILAIPYVHIGNAKVIFARKPADSEFGDYGELIMDQYLYRLTSKEMEVDPPSIPEPTLIGMQDVLDQNIFERIGKYIDNGMIKHFSLDFESDGLPMEVGFQPIGVSISVTKGKDPFNKLGPGSYDNQLDFSYYIDFRKIHAGTLNDDTKLPEYPEVKANFWEAFKDFMDKYYSFCWVYNCKFEINAFYVIFSKKWAEQYLCRVPDNMNNEEPPFYEMQDAYALAICDDNKRSLKFSAQKYLGVPSWDDQLDVQMDEISKLFKTFKSFDEMWSSYVLSKLAFDILPDNTKEHISELTENGKAYVYEFDSYNHIFDFWMDLDEGYREIILKRQEGEHWNYNPWVSADPDMMGTYCCFDSARTDQIVSKLYPVYKMPYENIYIKNWWLGAALEGNGMHCDTEKRQILSNFVYNVYNNVKLWMNRLYFKMYVQDKKDKFSQFDNHPARKVLMWHPELATMDYTWWGKYFIDAMLVTDDEWKSLGYEGENQWDKLNWNHLNDILPEEDVTSLQLELNWVADSLKELGYSGLRRKRGWMTNLTETAMPYFHTDELVKFINKYNLDKVKDKWKQFNEWFINALWMQDSSPVYMHRVIDELSWKDYQRSEDMQYLKDLPDEIVNNLRCYYDELNEDNYIINGFINNCPDMVLNSVYVKYHSENGIRIIDNMGELIDINELALYWQYTEKLEKYKILDSMKYDSPTPKELSADIDLFGYNSSQGVDNAAYWKLLLKYYGLQIISIAEYVIFTTNIDNKKIEEGYDPGRSFSADNGLHNNLEMLKKFSENVASHIEDSACYKNAMASDTTFFSGLDKCNCTAGVQWAMYNIFNSDMLTLTIDEDPFMLVMRLCIYKSYFHAAQKVTSTYIKALFANASQNYEIGPEKFQSNHVDGYTDPSNKTDILFWDWQTNQKSTKRWSSGFHTMKPHSDVMKCITSPDGWINTYFDISQAEPRSAAYYSHDKVWSHLYDTGVDSYMYLAHIAEPQAPDEVLREMRSDYKRSVISILYGIGDGSLASQLGKSIQETQKIRATFFGQFKEVHQLVMKKQLYAKKFGYVDTMLGDKMGADQIRWDKTGINYFMQNGAAVILASGFYMLGHFARLHGIKCYPKSIIHDSITNIVKIEDILKIALLYQKYFRKWHKLRYGIDFKYDLDLSINMLNHIGFKFDPNKMEVKIHAHKEDTDKILYYLCKRYDISFEVTKVSIANIDQLKSDWKGYKIYSPNKGSHIDIKDIEVNDELYLDDYVYDEGYPHGVDGAKNACDFFIKRIGDREHTFCTDPAFDDNIIREVKFKVNNFEQDVLDWYNDESDLPKSIYFDELKEYRKNEPRSYKTDQLDNYKFNDDGTIYDDKGNEVILFNKKH